MGHTGAAQNGGAPPIQISEPMKYGGDQNDLNELNAKKTGDPQQKDAVLAVYSDG